MENSKKIIVSFHIGRGGRFYNSGHVTFLGEENINHYTDDLFVRYDNQQIIRNTLKNRNLSNLLEKFDDCIESDNFNFFIQKFSDFEIGEQIYIDLNGNEIGLSVDNDGTGIINRDNNYDTTYAKYLEDCNEDELYLIVNSNTYCSDETLELAKQIICA